jgi:AraC family transcriptional regulator
LGKIAIFQRMEKDRAPPHATTGDGEKRPLQKARIIASGDAWFVSEYVCHAGPGDRPFEERHEGFTIAIVAEGLFTYRSEGGRFLLHPGALLLGNHGLCFECGHEHSAGDRCIAFHYSPDFFAEISASAGGGSRYRFSSSMLPMTNRSIPAVLNGEAIGSALLPLKVEESVFRFAETVIARVSGHTPSPARTTFRDEKRIAAALRHMEENAAEPLALGSLAAIAGVSKFHFLRMFQRSVAMTPYQFLLSVRMRRAALRLSRSSAAVSEIAFEAGFGDLSTFNSRFRDLFGMSPTAFRKSRVTA